ncbi:MAG: Fe-S cluster assembly protein SufB, partial [Parvicella sp.]
MKYTEDDLKVELENQEYEYGFTSDIKSEKAPNGINEGIVRFISEKKKEPEWLLEYRLNALKVWQSMTEPEWAHVKYAKPDFQNISYYAAPVKKVELASLDEVDPEIRKTMDKLGISMNEQKK